MGFVLAIYAIVVVKVKAVASFWLMAISIAVISR
jgi:hypothetical protein